MNHKARYLTPRPRRSQRFADDANEPTEAEWDDDGADHEKPTWVEDMFPRDAA